MNSPQTCVANPKQYPDAAASLTEAFLEDPVLSYLFEDEEYRPLLLSAFFANRLASRTETDLLLLPSGYENRLPLYGRNLTKTLKTILPIQELLLQ